MNACDFPTLRRKGFELPPSMIRAPMEASFQSPGKTFRRGRNVLFGDKGSVSDPLFAKTLLIATGADYTDYSAAAKGVANNAIEVPSAVNTLNNLNTMACSAGVGQTCEWASSALTADFCYEIYYSSTIDAGGMLFGGMDAANLGTQINFSGVNTIQMILMVGGVAQANPTVAQVETGAWTHLAIDRLGTSVKFFQGGNVFSTAAFAGTLNVGAHWDIGNWTSDIGLIGAWGQGYWAWCRITSASRYQANFTPPVPPYPLH